MGKTNNIIKDKRKYANKDKESQEREKAKKKRLIRTAYQPDRNYFVPLNIFTISSYFVSERGISRQLPFTRSDF